MNTALLTTFEHAGLGMALTPWGVTRWYSYFYARARLEMLGNVKEWTLTILPTSRGLVSLVTTPNRWQATTYYERT